jgi:hypothetical protein
MLVYAWFYFMLQFPLFRLNLFLLSEIDIVINNFQNCTYVYNEYLFQPNLIGGKCLPFFEIRSANWAWTNTENQRVVAKTLSRSELRRSKKVITSCFTRDTSRLNRQGAVNEELSHPDRSINCHGIHYTSIVYYTNFTEYLVTNNHRYVSLVGSICYPQVYIVFFNWLKALIFSIDINSCSC